MPRLYSLMELPRLLTQSRNDTSVSNKLLTLVCRLAMIISPHGKCFQAA
ncbi:MAG: hypothetical protein J6T41_02285 [Neisseriaceae bacterium]|nr:hypothetical protein [Neisseriaceae bacterium]